MTLCIFVCTKYSDCCLGQVVTWSPGRSQGRRCGRTQSCHQLDRAGGKKVRQANRQNRPSYTASINRIWGKPDLK